MRSLLQNRRFWLVALLLVVAFGGGTPGGFLPTAPPFESDTLRVLIVEDANRRSPRFAIARDVVQSTFTDQEVYILDADAQLENADPVWQRAREAVSGKPLPWMVGANGGRGLDRECPEDADEIIKLVNGLR